MVSKLKRECSLIWLDSRLQSSSTQAQFTVSEPSELLRHYNDEPFFGVILKARHLNGLLLKADELNLLKAAEVQPSRH
jgi:hypothetical protein